MNSLKTLWQFSRPHTIIGSICSMTCLYIMAINKGGFVDYSVSLILTLISGLACNIFIVGLNQIIDVDLDKINKPNLPIAAGVLSLKKAYQIIYVCLGISLVAAAFASFILLVMIVVILFIGIAYSVPPIQLKKHHLPAAICITLVRGLIVNMGMFLHFNYVVNHTYFLASSVWPLTAFVVAFSIAIAWFKDLSDTVGDKQFNFKTFPILYSKKKALTIGSGLVLLAYSYAMFWSWQHNISVLFWIHGMLMLLFVINLTYVQVENLLSIQKFYMRFWVFFFAEYLLFAFYYL